MAYGAGAMALPSREKLALLVNLPHAQAERELRETGGADLSLDAYYDLVLLATGSAQEAERRTRARRAALVRRGSPA